MADKKSIDSPTNQLALMRMYLQQMQPQQMQWQPVQDIGSGIAQGVTQAANSYLQRKSQMRMLQYLSQQEEAQRAAEAQAAQTQQMNMTNFLQQAGIQSPLAQSAAAAGLDASTVNNVLSHSYDMDKDGTDQQRKGIIFQGVYQSLVAKGVEPNAAVLAATKAAYGAEPLGGSQIGEMMGGDMKTAQMGQTIGQADINHNAMSPQMQMQLGNYGINPMDGVSEVKRQAEAGISATNNQWLPTMNTLKANKTVADTQGQVIGNNSAAIGLARDTDQYALGQGYASGTVTAPEMLKGSIGLSDNPVAAMNSVAGNKNLYNKGTLVPKGGMDFPAPQAPAQPAAPQQPNPMQSYYNLPPAAQSVVGPVLRQSIMNLPGQMIQGAGQNLLQGGLGIYNNAANGIDSTRRLFGW